MEKNQDKGFTLVELLIVIVILGILATVTVFAVRGITDQGQTSACNADKKTMQTAVEAFYAQRGTTQGDVTEALLISEGLIVEVSSGIDIQDSSSPADTTDGDVQLVWQADADGNSACGTVGADVTA